jgi:hypothetical protein
MKILQDMIDAIIFRNYVQQKIEYILVFVQQK